MLTMQTSVTFKLLIIIPFTCSHLLCADNAALGLQVLPSVPGQSATGMICEVDNVQPPYYVHEAETVISSLGSEPLSRLSNVAFRLLRIEPGSPLIEHLLIINTTNMTGKVFVTSVHRKYMPLEDAKIKWSYYGHKKMEINVSAVFVTNFINIIDNMSFWNMEPSTIIKQGTGDTTFTMLEGRNNNKCNAVFRYSLLFPHPSLRKEYNIAAVTYEELLLSQAMMYLMSVNNIYNEISFVEGVNTNILYVPTLEEYERMNSDCP